MALTQGLTLKSSNSKLGKLLYTGIYVVHYSREQDRAMSHRLDSAKTFQEEYQSHQNGWLEGQEAGA